MKLLSRILLNLLTLASALCCYQIWVTTRGFAAKFNFRSQQYFYWEDQGYLQFGVPGKSWHYFNSQLAIFITALLPTCRIILAYLRWSRKRYKRIAERLATLPESDAAMPLSVLPATRTFGSEITTSPIPEPTVSCADAESPLKREANILHYSGGANSVEPGLGFPSISVVCGILQVAYLCGVFGMMFRFYLILLTLGVLTSILSFAIPSRLKGARVLATLGSVLNFGAALYFMRLFLDDF